MTAPLEPDPLRGAVLVVAAGLLIGLLLAAAGLLIGLLVAAAGLLIDGLAAAAGLMGGIPPLAITFSFKLSLLIF